MKTLCNIDKLKNLMKKQTIMYVKKKHDDNFGFLSNLLCNELDTFLSDEHLRKISNNRICVINNNVCISIEPSDIKNILSNYFIKYEYDENKDYPVISFDEYMSNSPLFMIFVDSINEIFKTKTQFGCSVNMKTINILQYVERPNNESDDDIIKIISNKNNNTIIQKRYIKTD